MYTPLTNPPHPPYPTTNFTPNQFSAAAQHSQPQCLDNSSFISQRSYGFSSAEEAAAERRRRKRRLRIEPPLYALRLNPQSPPPSAADAADRARLPDSTSALVGPRLNLHNRVQSLIRVFLPLKEKGVAVRKEKTMADSSDSVSIDMESIPFAGKEHIIKTGHGSVSVAVFGEQDKPALITYPDLALN
ncbi:hypothetical protein SASPL_148959 [Salvia splendens]|uniref:Uncharacterized protein n=1 Tax=Salvia splendens TaxID=180675 RepID=A0A8X8WAV6_SALSN|nr:hypothetical protein SASPL_148959 [Salvia splendens]